MERVKFGVFGGTFDPPHNGHLALARAARRALGLDAVLWVLTPMPPHKPDREFAPLADRLAMVQAIVEREPAFLLSRVDIDRPPPHFAVDTMHLLRQQNPEAELIYLMGEDSLRDLPFWHRPKEFLSVCDALGVMRRPGVQVDLTALERVLPGVGAKIRWVEAPLCALASSEIRRRIQRGESVEAYLPPPVLEIVERRRLYR